MMTGSYLDNQKQQIQMKKLFMMACIAGTISMQSCGEAPKAPDLLLMDMQRAKFIAHNPIGIPFFVGDTVVVRKIWIGAHTDGWEIIDSRSVMPYMQYDTFTESGDTLTVVSVEKTAIVQRQVEPR